MPFSSVLSCAGSFNMLIFEALSGKNGFMYVHPAKQIRSHSLIWVIAGRSVASQGTELPLDSK